MNYTIQEIDIHNNRIREQIIVLVDRVFNLKIDHQKLVKNTETRNGKTLYLGAFYGDELAAINFFIGHELQIEADNIIAHQSCWSAVSPDHRRKGLFSKLIEEAKIILKNKNSAFIFGFPNQNSEGIFINKLGFKSYPMSKLNIPANRLLGFTLNRDLKKIDSDFYLKTEKCVLPLEGEIYEWKREEFGNDVYLFSSYNNLVWGKRRRIQKFGKNLTYLDVGGIQVNKPNLIHDLFAEIRRAKKFDFFQIVASSNAVFWEMFKGVQFAPKIEPLIIYDLNLSTSALQFQFFKGIKDVF